MVNRRLKRLDTSKRILISIGLALLPLFFIPQWLHLSAKILVVWDTGTFIFLLLTWLVMLDRTPDRIGVYNRRQGSRMWIGSLSLSAICTILAIFYVLNTHQNAPPSIIALHITLAGVTIINSWFLLHTVFARHYAHGYYQEDKNTGKIARGLSFPHDQEPDYLDFLYFSFVIGMTCQVSDVRITSRSLRRVSLAHGIISFFFNTTILAMTINLVGKLI